MNEEQNQDTQTIEEPIATAEKNSELSSVTDLLTQSFKAYKAIFWKLIGMQLVPILFGLAFGILLLVYLASNFLFNGPATVNITNIIFGLLGFSLIIIMVVVSFIVKAGIYVLIRDYKKRLSIKEAFFIAKKITWGFVVVNLSIALFVFLWSLLFIIPGLVMAVFYSMALWSYFYEGFTGTSALKRSKELVKGYFWPIVFRYGVVIISFMAIFYLPFIFIDSAYFYTIWSGLGNMASFLLAPFLIIFHFGIFLELKKIKGESKIGNKTKMEPSGLDQKIEDELNINN